MMKKNKNIKNIDKKKNVLDISNNLFLFIMEGNLYEMINFLNNNEIHINIKNENEENLLHMVLKNSKNENEKLDMCKYLIKKGISLSSFDLNGATPLHISIKMGFNKITKLFIENKADISIKDCQNKNILHYYVLGETFNYPLIRKKKVLIEDYKITDNIKKIDNFLKLIYIYLNDNKDIKIYFDHIFETIKNITNFYKNKFIEVEKETIETISNLINKENILEEDKEKIIETSLNLKNSIKENILNCITEFNTPLELKPNNDGYSISNKFKIFENKGIQYILKELNDNSDSLKINTFNHSNSVLESINEINFKSNNFNNNLDEYLNQIYIFDFYITTFYLKNIKEKTPDSYDKYLNLVNEHKNKFHKIYIDKEELSKTYIIPQITYISIINIFENKIIFFNDDKLVYQNSNIKSQKPYRHQCKRYNNDEEIKDKDLLFLTMDYNWKTPEINNNLYNNDNLYVCNYFNGIESEDTIDIDLGDLDDDSNLGGIISLNPLQLDPTDDITFIDWEEFNNNPSNIDTKTDKDGYYFNWKLKYLNRFKNICIENIKNKIKEIINLIINENNFKLVYEKISHVLIFILNLIVLIYFIKKEIKIIRDKIISLNPLINEYYNSFINFKMPRFILKEPNDILKKLQEDIDLELSNCDTFYDRIKGLFTILNNVIDYVNFNTALKILKSFYNDDNDLEILKKENTDHVNDIFYNSLNQIKNIPETLEGFSKFINETDMIQTKKMIFEEFLIKIDDKYQLNYIDNNLNERDVKDGYLLYNVDFNSLGINLVNSKTKDSKEFTLDGSIYYFKNEFNDSKIFINGYYGIKNNYELSKSNHLLYSSSKLLGKHLLILKECIIKFILEEIYKNKNNNTNLSLEFKEIYKKIKEKYGNNNKLFLLIFIGKCLDEVIISFIEHQCNIKSGEILNNCLENNNYIDFQPLLDKHNIRNIISLKNNNEVFKLDKIKILSNTKNLFKEDDKIIDVLLDDELLREIKNKDLENIKKLLNINNSTDKIDFKYFKRNEELLEYILKKCKTSSSNSIINKEDIYGKTPLHYAIEMFDISTIKLLLKYGSFKTGKFKIFSPLDLSINLYNDILKCSDEDKKIIIFNENIIKTINKITQKEFILKYFDLSLDYFIYLINFYFYYYEREYYEGWTYEKSKELRKMIKLKEDKYVFPIIKDINDSNIVNERYLFTIKIINESINDLKKKNNIQKLQLIELKKEYEETKSINVNDKINTINNKIKEYEGKINEYEDKILSIKNLSFKTDSISGNKDKIDTSNIFILLENLFKYLNNKREKLSSKTETKLYYRIWREHLEKGDYKEFKLLYKINEYEKEYFTSNRKEFLKDKSNLILDFYKLIKKIINDYQKLEYIYNYEENYVLTDFINIMVNVVKRFLCLDLFNVISQCLITHISKIIEFNIDKDYINNIMIKILDKSNLMTYIFDFIPIKIIKIILNIYEGENDPDKELSFNIIFNNLNNILKSITILNLDIESPLIKKLNEEIYPYFEIYFTTVINNMKNLLDNYLNDILLKKKILKIVKIINN